MPVIGVVISDIVPRSLWSSLFWPVALVPVGHGQ